MQFYSTPMRNNFNVIHQFIFNHTKFRLSYPSKLSFFKRFYPTSHHGDAFKNTLNKFRQTFNAKMKRRIRANVFADIKSAKKKVKTSLNLKAVLTTLSKVYKPIPPKKTATDLILKSHKLFKPIPKNLSFTYFVSRLCSKSLIPLEVKIEVLNLAENELRVYWKSGETKKVPAPYKHFLIILKNLQSNFPIYKEPLSLSKIRVFFYEWTINYNNKIPSSIKERVNFLYSKEIQKIANVRESNKKLVFNIQGQLSLKYSHQFLLCMNLLLKYIETQAFISDIDQNRLINFLKETYGIYFDIKDPLYKGYGQLLGDVSLRTPNLKFETKNHEKLV